jgi:Lrp/AsnC family transcriptional regulator for asnA, asnC and gidA
MVDNFDLKLIKALQEDGRESYVNLAKKLGVVEGTVRKRIKHLINKNIMRIIAVPNVEALGYNFISIIGFQVTTTEIRKVAEKLAQNPHVCYLSYTTGRYDLIAFLIAQSTEEHTKIVESEIMSIPNIARTETFINLKIVKGLRGLPDVTQLISDNEIASSKKT